ncbi:MAG: hypothetical protein V1708_04390 [Candidatus Micrarchaeota archaeon]
MNKQINAVALCQNAALEGFVTMKKRTASAAAKAMAYEGSEIKELITAFGPKIFMPIRTIRFEL